MDFLAASGVQALGAVLERPHVGPMELHMALVCLDGLTRAAGVAGCEAALGWWMPGLDPEQVWLPFLEDEHTAVLGAACPALRLSRTTWPPRASLATSRLPVLSWTGPGGPK